jgi:O-antigen/teichoic acid export membrane protein
MTALERSRTTLIRTLRWIERYTKTDMVYLAKAGFWSNLNFGVTSLLALALSVAFGHLLPPDVFGLYQYLLSLSALLTAICLSGMSRAVTQSVARGHEGDLKHGLIAQLKWNLIPTAIGISGALYYIWYGNAVLGIGLAAIALLAPIVSAFNIYSAFLQGKQDFKRIFTYGMSVNLTYYVSMFIAVPLFKQAAVLILVNLGANALATVLAYLRTIRTYKPNNQTDPHTISYGSHLSFLNAFGTVINQLDSVLVFHLLGAAPLAVYSIATLLPERIGGMLNFIGLAALPKFATHTRETIRKTIVPKALRMMLVGSALAIVYAVSAPLLFQLLFPKYLDAVVYTQLYAPIVMLLATTNFVGTVLVAQRLKTEIYITSFLHPISLILLQIPLLVAYGITGMLIARIISDVLQITVTLLLLIRVPRNKGPESVPQPS